MIRWCYQLVLVGILAARQSNGIQQDLPQLRIPPCPRVATIEKFWQSNPATLVAPKQQTRVAACYSSLGLIFRTNATDKDIFSAAKKCDSPVFAQGDTLEVFAGAVQRASDNPMSYLEIDTGSSGALWGSRSYNKRGNVSNCGVQHATRCPEGTINCTGLADFGKDGPSVSVTTGPAATGSTTAAGTAVADRTVHAASSWWADTLTLPWALFHEPFVDHAASPPWRLFRMNFYRYDYPSQFTNGSWDRHDYELSAWSPTHVVDSFHVPNRFGVVMLVD